MCSFLIKSAGFYHLVDSIPTPFYSQFHKSDLHKRILWGDQCYHQIGTVNVYKFNLIERAKAFISLVPRFIFIHTNSDLDVHKDVSTINDLWQRAFGSSQNVDVFVREDSFDEIQSKYHVLARGRAIPKLIAPHPHTRIEQLTNRGIAVIANYLKNKSNLSNLFICADLDAFKEKLKEIAAAPEDQKIALIVAAHQFEMQRDKKAVIEQHNMAVCVEKIDGHLHIAVLEPSYQNEVDPSHLNFEWGVFVPQELVFTYIKEAELNPVSTSFYSSSVGRQYGELGGCGVFALRDAVNFLKNPQFFEQIKIDNNENISLPWGTIQRIRLLPPEYMKSIQSQQAINIYKKYYSDAEIKCYQDSITKHLAEDLNKNKQLNKYIDDRAIKYQKIITQTVEKSSDEEINQLINNVLIKN